MSGLTPGVRLAPPFAPRARHAVTILSQGTGRNPIADFPCSHEGGCNIHFCGREAGDPL